MSAGFEGQVSIDIGPLESGDHGQVVVQFYENAGADVEPATFKFLGQFGISNVVGDFACYPEGSVMEIQFGHDAAHFR